MVTGAGDGRRRAAADGSRARADGSRARAESRDETRTRERVRRAGGERSSEWLGFGGVAASSFIWGGAGGGRGLGRARRACAWSCALGGGGGNGPPPGRPLERAVPVPCLGPGVRPKYGSLLRAVLARACWPPGRAGLGPGQKNGPRAGPTGSGCMANYTYKYWCFPPLLPHHGIRGPK